MTLYHSDLIKLTQTRSGMWQQLKTKAPYQQAWQENQLIYHTKLNPLCGDQVTWYTQIKAQKFSLLAHDTMGCILCQATSILTHQQLLEQPVDCLDKIIQNNAFTQPQPAFTQVWKIFDPVLSHKSRLKCVSLSVLALQELLSTFSSQYSTP